MFQAAILVQQAILIQLQQDLMEQLDYQAILTQLAILVQLSELVALIILVAQVTTIILQVPITKTRQVQDIVPLIDLLTMDQEHRQLESLAQHHQQVLLNQEQVQEMLEEPHTELQL